MFALLFLRLFHVCLFVSLFPAFYLFPLFPTFLLNFLPRQFGVILQVATFDTVEDFWALMNYVSEANNLPVGSDYSLFKVAQQNQKLVYFGWVTVEHIFQMIKMKIVMIIIIMY